jgi:hypothetical protein
MVLLHISNLALHAGNFRKQNIVRSVVATDGTGKETRHTKSRTLSIPAGISEGKFNAMPRQIARG